MISDDEVAAQYRAAAAAYGRDAERSRRRSERIGQLRIVVFLAIVAAVVGVATAPAALRPIALLTAGAAAVIFAILVWAHRRERTLLERWERSREYHEQGALRVARDWSALPLPSTSQAPPAHPYAQDLSVTGRASLLQLLDVASAAPGRPTLVDWLLAPAPTAHEIRERQDGARELLDRRELREELGVLARMAGDVSPEALDRFIRWCESPPWLLQRPFLLWSARAVAVVTAVALLLQAAGVLPWPLWLLSAAAGGALTLAARSGLRAALSSAEPRASTLRHHAAMLGVLAAADLQSPRLSLIRSRIEAGGGAQRQFARLERVVAWGEVRYSPMLHGALQWLFAWDVHVVARLERWRRDAGAHVRDWLAALGEGESLAALATLAHDNPGWTFPELSDRETAPVIKGVAVGHPLIPAAARVPNDISVGPPETFLLITGSNMSGKSTLLRAIGANVVLAQAGAPVCAASFRLPLLGVQTSIRVQDSLEEGISLFMAELRRLKTIVDAARAASRAQPVLYLLDEMLHGTNSAERRIAARTVIGHLIRAGAIGAVTTHDLALAADGELASAARAVHFSEWFDRSANGTTMRFDYRLRPGLATSANALALLDLVGLGDTEHH